MIERLILAFRLRIAEYVKPIVTPEEKLERYLQSLFKRPMLRLYKNLHLKWDQLEDLEFNSIEKDKLKLVTYFDKYELLFLKNLRVKTVQIIFSMLAKIRWDLIQFNQMDFHFRPFILIL